MDSGEKVSQNVDGDRAKGDGGKIGKRVVGALNREFISAESDEQFEDSKRVRDAFKNIDGEGNFCFGDLPYARPEEEGFSGDGASLFMLVRFQKEDGPKTELVKIGWGEFSKQTFTKGDKSKYSEPYIDFRNGKPEYRIAAEHEVLRNLPFDVYCVSQGESYLADGEIRNDMYFCPEKYLREHALFVVNDGNVTMASEQDTESPRGEGNRNLDYSIVPITEGEALDLIGGMQDLYKKTIEELSMSGSAKKLVG